MCVEVLKMEISLENIPNLCRVCLISSTNLVPLSGLPTFKTEHLESKITIHQILELVTSNQIFIDDECLPSQICQNCLSLLKVSLEFHMQFTKSQLILQELIQMPAVDKKRIVREEGAEEAPAPVELIYGESKFDLKDVVVIEEEETRKDGFEGFLNNLGSEITAEYVKDEVEDEKEEQIGDEVVQLEEEVVLQHEKPKFIRKKGLKKKHRCAKCDSTFYLKADLIAHRPECNPPQQLVCDKCGHVSNNKSKFRYHRLTHKDPKFQCDQCPKRYRTSTQLKEHKVTHDDLRPHLCTVCGKSFNYSVALTYHMRLHTGEKNYVCNYCGRQFNMSHALKTHVMRHENVKPFRCGVCEKSFSTTSERKMHQVLHSGEMQFKCEYCEKRFAKKWTRHVHQMAHEGPFGCPLCKKSFIEEEFLNSHVDRVHNKKVVKKEEEEEDLN